MVDEDTFTGAKWLPVCFIGLFPFSVAYFPILARQLFEILIACQEIKKKFLFIPSKTGHLCPNWSGG